MSLPTLSSSNLAEQTGALLLRIDDLEEEVLMLRAELVAQSRDVKQLPFKRRADDTVHAPTEPGFRFLLVQNEVRWLGRCQAAVLEALKRMPEQVSANDIIERWPSDLPSMHEQNVHRALRVLTERGFLLRQGPRRRYVYSLACKTQEVAA